VSNATATTVSAGVKGSAVLSVLPILWPGTTVPPPEPPGSRMPEKPFAILPLSGLAVAAYWRVRLRDPSGCSMHPLRQCQHVCMCVRVCARTRLCGCAHDLEAMKRLECARLLSPPPPGMSDTGVGEAIKFRRTSASSSCRSSCSLIARSWPLISRC